MEFKWLGNLLSVEDLEIWKLATAICVRLLWQGNFPCNMGRLEV